MCVVPSALLLVYLTGINIDPLFASYSICFDIVKTVSLSAIVVVGVVPVTTVYRQARWLCLYRQSDSYIII